MHCTCPLLGVKRTSLPHRKMSAYDGGLNGSTQHFILEGKDGVYSEGSAISSRFRSGREGGAVKSLAEGESLKRSDGRLVSRHLPFIAKQPCMGGDLTQVLRRPVELATQSGHRAQTLHNDDFSDFCWRIYLVLRGGLRRCTVDWQSVALSRTIYGLARKCLVFRIRIPQADSFERSAAPG